MYNSRGIIALDLDGTLLNTSKELSKRNLQALYEAFCTGFEIIPTTGRFYDGIPHFVRELPFIKYVITINGAQAIDLTNGTIIYKAEIPYHQAINIMSWLDQYPVIYDCYMDNQGWMSISHKEKADFFIEDLHSRKLVHELRHPVPELKQFLMEQRMNVQKIQLFSNNANVRKDLMKKLTSKYPDLSITSALPQNVEINQIHGNKGKALLAVANYLGVAHASTFSFGDGLNDLSMIKSAGTGFAMSNSTKKVLEAADIILPSNDEDGVAYGIHQYILTKQR